MTADTLTNIGLQADLQSCTAPGYYNAHTGFNESFAGLTLPVGWSVLNDGGTCNWSFNNPGSRLNLTGGSGNFAVADSDACGSGHTMNTELRSPIINIASLSSVPFQFKYDYYTLQPGESAAVGLSGDGGLSWQDFYTMTFTTTLTTRGPKTYNQDLTALLSGASQAQVRFRYVAPGWDWWWEVDDVSLGSPSCTPLSGGLVVGNVTDANTGNGLNGTSVSNQGGYHTATVPTPDDPGVGEGFYTLFSPAGSQVFNASQQNYSNGTANVNVVSNNTVRQDFALQAGRLSYIPANLNVGLSVGASTVQPITLTNSGGSPAAFTLFELNKASAPIGPFEKPGFQVRPFRQEGRDTQHIVFPARTAAPPYTGSGGKAAGDVQQSWNSGMSSPWGIAYDSQRDTVWVADGWGTQDVINEFNPAGIATGNFWKYTWPTAAGPADAAYNWNTGKIWLMNVNPGFSNCIYEIDPASGPTGNTICPGGGSGFTTSQRGLTYDPSTDTYFAGSWNELIVYRFAPDGTIIGSKNTGLPIAGLAYNPETQHLFVMTNEPGNAIHVLDVANSYADIGQFSIPGFTNYSGGGLELDCAGNLWAVDINSMKVYQVTSGEATNVCYSNVSWLSLSPISGTIPAHSTQTINATFNASGLFPSIEHAQIAVRTDTPYSVPNLPVTLTVIPNAQIYLPFIAQP